MLFNSTAKGWEVSEGTVPAGSMWRENPIARTVNEWFMYGAAFEPVCDEPPACRDSHHRYVYVHAYAYVHVYVQ